MKINVTVCELPDNSDALASAWPDLIKHVTAHGCDLLVLHEAPFDSWFARTPEFDQKRWDLSVARHRDGIEGLRELGCSVLATAWVDNEGHRYNQAFSWEPGEECSWWRRKSFIPDEEPTYEASWYETSNDAPDVRTIAGARVGVLTCTEIWAMDWASQLGRLGAQIIATPRATGGDSLDKWLAAGRVAAITSGAFSVSSNRSQDSFGGMGWIITPDGEVVATTSSEEPVVSCTIDLTLADHAKTTYPRYALWRAHDGQPSKAGNSPPRARG